MRKLAQAISGPRELGFGFEKFSEWREHQVEALSKILSSGKRFIVCEMPTGAGKTLVSIALVRLLGTKAVYTCSTKALQAQVISEFVQTKELKGRANYPCLVLAGLSAECCLYRAFKACKDCFGSSGLTTEEWIKLRWLRKCPYDNSKICFLCPYRFESCPYYNAKSVALGTEVAVLNRAYFLTEANWVGDFSNRKPWLILDEADTLDDTLRGFIELSVSEKQLESIGYKPPRYKTKWEAWKEWAEEKRGITGKRIEVLEQSIERGEWETEDLKLKSELEKLHKKLLLFVEYLDEYWVSIFEEKRWTFKPVLVSPYAEQFIFRHAERFLLMSATICGVRRFCYEIGIPLSETEFIQLPSVFPVENRRVFFTPAAKLSRKTESKEFPKVVEKFDQILDQYPNLKGIAHAVSFERAKKLVALSRHKERLVTHGTKDRLKALERFKQARKPLILVSPSLERGTDLPYDDARLCFWIKVPFGNLGDPQVNKRVHAFADGSQWYSWEAVRSLVQGTGRVSRAKDDWSISFILDGEFGRLLEQNREFFPKWWLDSTSRDDSFPNARGSGSHP